VEHFIEESEINKTSSDLNNPEDLADKEFISKRVSEIKNTIQELYKELDEITSKCNHSDGYDIRLITADRNKNSSSLLRICKICKSPIGYPSKEEADEWQKS